MRIECYTISDFIINLETYVKSMGGKVFNKTVYWSFSRRSISTLMYNVIVQASAVIELEDTSQFILEAGQDCGEDNEAVNGIKSGSILAASMKNNLRDVCSVIGVILLPGHIQP